LGVVARLACLVGLSGGLLGRGLAARLGQAPLDRRALLLQDPLERLPQLVDDLAEVVPLDPLLPGLLGLLAQLAQALQALASRGRTALANSSIEASTCSGVSPSQRGRRLSVVKSSCSRSASSSSTQRSGSPTVKRSAARCSRGVSGALAASTVGRERRLSRS